MIGQFLRDYSQLLSGLMIGLCSLAGTLGAGLFIGGEVEEGLGKAKTPENIEVSAQGFGSKDASRLLIAHNFGEKSGTLLPEIVIIVRDKSGKEITPRQAALLNEGTAGYGTANPFTLLGDQGRRFYLNHVELPEGANRCVVQFQVMRPGPDPRMDRTSEFDCVKRSSQA